MIEMTRKEWRETVLINGPAWMNELARLAELAESNPEYRLAVVDDADIPWHYYTDDSGTFQCYQRDYRRVVKMEGEQCCSSTES